MMKCKKIVFGIIAPWAVAIVALPSVVGGRNADAIYFDDEDADDKDSSTHDLAKVLSQMEKVCSYIYIYFQMYALSLSRLERLLKRLILINTPFFYNQNHLSFNVSIH